MPIATTFSDQLEHVRVKGYVAARRILHDDDLARDASQEAASRALAAHAQYDSSRPFYPWFYRIVKNCCLDIMRRTRRDLNTIGAEDIWRVTPKSAELALIQNDREQAVIEAISKLNPAHREIIELRHFQELSDDEIAEVLGCEPGTVMSRLYRARAALRGLLSTAKREGIL